jgi:hypothetical protein
MRKLIYIAVVSFLMAGCQLYEGGRSEADQGTALSATEETDKLQAPEETHVRFELRLPIGNRAVLLQW